MIAAIWHLLHSCQDRLHALKAPRQLVCLACLVIPSALGLWDGPSLALPFHRSWLEDLSSSQDAVQEASLSLSAQSWVPGESVSLRLEASWPLGWSLDRASHPLAELPHLWVLDAQGPDVWRDGQRFWAQWHLTLRVEDESFLTLPALQIYLRDSAGRLQELQSEALFLSQEALQQLPVDQGPGFWREELVQPSRLAWLLLVLLIVAISLLLVLLFFLRRGRQAAVPADPYRDCLRVFAELEHCDESRTAAARLAGALRAYLSACWGFPALAATPEECARQLPQLGEDSHRQRLLGLLTSLEEQRWQPEAPSWQNLRSCQKALADWLQEDQRLRAQIIAQAQSLAQQDPAGGARA